MLVSTVYIVVVFKEKSSTLEHSVAQFAFLSLPFCVTWGLGLGFMPLGEKHRR